MLSFFSIKKKNFFYNICSSTINSSKGTSKKRSLIWVYLIDDLSLVKEAPFKTKTECANILHINRSTVASYLDSDKLYDNKWIFSSTVLSKEELSKWSIPSKIMDIIIGELLGDGHINYKSQGVVKKNSRLVFRFSAKNIQYVKFLKYEALAFICTKSIPHLDLNLS